MNENTASYIPQLGRAIKDYKKSSASVVKVTVVSLVSALIAAFFFVGAFSGNDPSLAQQIVLSIVGLLFTLPVILAIVLLIRGRGASLSLHENGLIYRSGGKQAATTWDEIDSYLQE